MYSNKHADVVKVFWDGKDKNGNQLRFDKGFKEAIRRAYKDYMPRTMTRKAVTVNDITNEMVEYVCDGSKFEDGISFLDKIKEWFYLSTNINEKDYDNWHEVCCAKILQCFNEYYANGVTYGKAQKIVNMTMKGVYCLPDAENYEDYFKYCHMALDSIILEWFKRDVVPHHKKDNKIDTNMIDVWSNFNKGNYKRKVKNQEKDYYGYDFYVEKIRSYFSDSAYVILNTFQISGLTPFQAEFYIWRDMQIHTLTEALFSQEFGREERIYKVNELCKKPNSPANIPEKDTFRKAKMAFKTFKLGDKLEIVKDAINFIIKELN